MQHCLARTTRIGTKATASSSEAAHSVSFRLLCHCALALLQQRGEHGEELQVAGGSDVVDAASFAAEPRRQVRSVSMNFPAGVRERGGEGLGACGRLCGAVCGVWTLPGAGGGRVAGYGSKELGGDC